MRTKQLVIVTVLLTMFTAFTSCTDENEDLGNSIIGTWEPIYYNDYYMDDKGKITTYATEGDCSDMRIIFNRNPYFELTAYSITFDSNGIFTTNKESESHSRSGTYLLNGNILTLSIDNYTTQLSIKEPTSRKMVLSRIETDMRIPGDDIPCMDYTMRKY